MSDTDAASLNGAVISTWISVWPFPGLLRRDALMLHYMLGNCQNGEWEGPLVIAALTFPWPVYTAFRQGAHSMQWDGWCWKLNETFGWQFVGPGQYKLLCSEVQVDGDSGLILTSSHQQRKIPLAPFRQADSWMSAWPAEVPSQPIAWRTSRIDMVIVDDIVGTRIIQPEEHFELFDDFRLPYLPGKTKNIERHTLDPSNRRPIEFFGTILADVRFGTPNTDEMITLYRTDKGGLVLQQAIDTGRIEEFWVNAWVFMNESELFHWLGGLPSPDQELMWERLEIVLAHAGVDATERL